MAPLTFNLDPRHPVAAAVHQGVRGQEGHVVIRRAEARDLRFEPAAALNTSRRLRSALIWQLIPTDDEPYGYSDGDAARIAYVVRMLCGVCAAPTEAQETDGILGAFLSDAEPVEGLTTYGETQHRYEALRALRGTVDPNTGRQLGSARYLIDENTGELVIRAGDLQAAARRHLGCSVQHGWLDARLDGIGWRRVTVQGYALSGRQGRRGAHLRSVLYRGLLPDDDEGSVNT